MLKGNKFDTLRQKKSNLIKYTLILLRIFYLFSNSTLSQNILLILWFYSITEYSTYSLVLLYHRISYLFSNSTLSQNILLILWFYFITQYSNMKKQYKYIQILFNISLVIITILFSFIIFSLILLNKQFFSWLKTKTLILNLNSQY
jgi:hypothetical protein